MSGRSLSRENPVLTAKLDEHLDAIRALVASLDPSSLTGDLAASLAERFVAGEHACAAGKAICARRVADTGRYTSSGHKDGADWLADLSGETRTAAKDLLEVVGGLADLPALDEVFRSGELSPREAAEISRAASLDPSAESDLLDTARRGSFGELRNKADAVRAAARSAEDQQARHARLHKNRSLSSWTDREGAFAGRFSLTPEDGAVVMGRLESIANGLFDEARKADRQEPRAAYLADALVALADGEAGGAAGASGAPGGAASASGAPDGAGAFRAGDGAAGAPGEADDFGERVMGAAAAEVAAAGGASRLGRPDYTIIMRVDLDALIRGAVERGEECMIEGTGHVPVSIVQSYLDAACLRLVVTNGTDITSVFSFSRTIPSALRTALEHRDRTCVVPGCTSTFHLEIDHIVEFAKGGPTSLANLCRWHHGLKTREGYRIDGGPGAWKWVRPSRAPSPSATPADPDRRVPRRADAAAHPSPSQPDPGPHPVQERLLL